MVRCFIAVKLGEEIEAPLRELQNKAKQLDIDASFPSDFHCTLAFLGELYEDQVEKTKERLEKLQLKQTQVEVKGVGFFPNGKCIRVFWAGVKGLDEMQNSIAKALRHREEFLGHVTIARIKNPGNLSQLREIAKAYEEKEFGTTTISGVALFKSVLTAQGPQHEELFVKKLS